MKENLSDNGLGSLVHFLKHESDPWGIKDLDSRFVYVNNLSHLGIKYDFDIEGLLDSELPHPVAELSTALVKHDNDVIENNTKESVIQISMNYKNNTLEPYLFEKRPFYNTSGNIAGTIYHGRKFNIHSIQHIFADNNASVLLLDPPNNQFTKGECRVIFWLLQKLSSKEIARKLNLSHRTVENKLQNIYGKIGVNSAKQLKEYSISMGFDRYIPREELTSCVNFVRN